MTGEIHNLLIHLCTIGARVSSFFCLLEPCGWAAFRSPLVSHSRPDRTVASLQSYPVTVYFDNLDIKQKTG